MKKPTHLQVLAGSVGSFGGQGMWRREPANKGSKGSHVVSKGRTLLAKPDG